MHFLSKLGVGRVSLSFGEGAGGLYCFDQEPLGNRLLL